MEYLATTRSMKRLSHAKKRLPDSSLPDSLPRVFVERAIKLIDEEHPSVAPPLTPHYVIPNLDQQVGKYEFYPVDDVFIRAINQTAGFSIGVDERPRLYQGSKAFKLLREAGFSPIAHSDESLAHSLKGR